MIFHEDCALNIEHTLFKGSDVVVIGWVKGDAGMSLMQGNTTLATNLIRSERPDVAEYFGIKNNECFGFALYSSQSKPSAKRQTALRLLDKKSSTWEDVLLLESEDHTDGLRIIDGLKEKGLPDDFFQEGILIDGIKHKIGTPADRRTAVGHIEVAKSAKDSKGLLLIGWAVSKSPNNIMIKVGDSFFPYDSFFSYPRPDIEEAFSKTYGQNARKGGFIAFYPDPDFKSGAIQLYYCKRNTKTLHLIASNELPEKEIPFEDLQQYLQGIHTPELTLTDRVKKVDGPLASTALRYAEEGAYYVRPEILIHEFAHEPSITVNVIVPKGLTGDILQSIMSFVTLNVWSESIAVNYFFCDVATDGGQLNEIANRTHTLFGGQVAVFNGCTNLLLGHVGYGVGKSSASKCFIVDARSGFEYQSLKTENIFETFSQDELRVFYARDVNGVSGTTLSFEALGKYVNEGTEKDTVARKPYSRNKVFGFALLGKTMVSLCNDMGFVPLRELTDLEFLIRRSDQLSNRYNVERKEIGLPFARTHAKSEVFHASLGRQVELYTMAQVGV